MQHGILVFSKVSASWLDIRLLSLLTNPCLLLPFFMHVTQLQLQIRPRGKLLAEDALVYPEISVYLVQI